MRKGKVSLITPCYNGQAFTQLYIKNILCQNYPKVEVIFVNDGSSDNIEAMISEIRDAVLSKGYEFVYLSKDNGGAASAVNMALKYVTGDYLMLLDMDDELFEDAISAKAEYLDSHPEIDTVISNGYYVFEDKRRRKSWFYRKTKIDSEKMFEMILQMNFYNWPGSYMVRCNNFFKVNSGREIFQSRYGQNMQILLPAVYNGHVFFLNRYLMNYYIRERSASHSRDKSLVQQFLTGYEEIRESVVNKICRTESERQYYLQLVRVASIRKKMHYACRKNDRDELERQYTKLTEMKKVAFRDVIVHMSGKNVFFVWCYKCVCFLIERFTNRLVY